MVDGNSLVLGPYFVRQRRKIGKSPDDHILHRDDHNVKVMREEHSIFEGKQVLIGPRREGYKDCRRSISYVSADID